MIAELAHRQHGVVARWQLIAEGFGRGAIAHRIKGLRLHVIYPGVYAVGHRALTREARWMAAVLLAGPGAVLSHRSAAALWGMRSSIPQIDVSLDGNRRSRAGLAMHRVALPHDEVTNLRGIPITTSPRTIFDLAATRPRREAEEAFNEAEVLRLSDPLSVLDLLERRPRRRGAATIRAILAAHRGTTITRSQLERDFLAFVDRTGLPRPIMNAPLDPGGRRMTPDAQWPEHRLVVELDGYRAHGTHRAFVSDRRRSRWLQVAGWQNVRVTWADVHETPDELEADLRAMMSRPWGVV